MFGLPRRLHGRGRIQKTRGMSSDRKEKKQNHLWSLFLDARLFAGSFIYIISLIQSSRHLYPCLYVRILRSGEIKLLAQAYTNSELLISDG